MRKWFVALLVVSFLACPAWAKEAPLKKIAKTSPSKKTVLPVKPPAKPQSANKHRHHRRRKSNLTRLILLSRLKPVWSLKEITCT